MNEMIIDYLRSIKPRLLGRITKLLYSGGSISIGRNFRCDSIPSLSAIDGSIVIGDNVIIKKYVELRSSRKGILEIGNSCILDRGVRIISANSITRFGNNVKIGFYSVINGGGGVEILDNTSLYGFVYIQTSTHIDKGEKIDLKSSVKFIHKKVKIGRNVLVGAHTSILPGSVIEDNVTIAFNSVIDN